MGPLWSWHSQCGTGRADVRELVLGDPISRFRTRKHTKCGGDKEIQKVWRCGWWALAGGAGFGQAGRNQSGLRATGRSARSSCDPGLASKGGAPRGHRTGQGIGSLRQASVCLSSLLLWLKTILLPLLPIHSTPPTSPAPSCSPTHLTKVTIYARQSREVAGCMLGAGLLRSNPDPATHGMCVFGKLVVSLSPSFLKCG